MGRRRPGCGRRGGGHLGGVVLGGPTISRLDPDTGRIEATFPVQLPERRVGPSRFATVADGRLWVVSAIDDDAPKSAISAIDPSTGHT
jgi:hypothetical protein